MKRLFISLTFAILCSIFVYTGCKEKGEIYTVTRTVGARTMITSHGAYLYLESDTDHVYDFEASKIGEFNAMVKSKIDIIDTIKSGGIKRYGVICSESQFPFYDNAFYRVIEDNDNTSDKLEFESQIKDLVENKTYYVRSFVITSKDTGYNSQIRKFTAPISEDVWLRKSDIKNDFINRTECISFVRNDKAYIGLGFNGITPLNDIWEYNPTTDTWQQVLNFAFNRSRRSAVCFVINDILYIGTGNSSMNPDVPIYERDFWAYDFQKPSFLWKRKDSMPSNGFERANAIGFAIGDKGYCGLGQGNLSAAFLSDFYMYDPKNDFDSTENEAWTKKMNFGLSISGNLGLQRREAVAVSIKGRAYVGLGLDQNNQYQKDFWVYTPESNTWTRMPDLPGAPRANAAAFALNYVKKDQTDFNSIFVGTGRNETEVFSDFYEFEISSSTWVKRHDFIGNERQGAVGFALKYIENAKTIYCGYFCTGNGGLNPNTSNKYKDNYQYLPKLTD